MSHNLLENLNNEQLEAVTHKDGPIMIIAGAGTGKTTVITQRIAWLIEQGLAKPSQILALTFTEKAATEMEERVDQLLPIGYVDMWISTFHSFCERILREHALDIGLPHEFTLLDQIDTYLLVRKNIDRFELNYYRPKSDPTRFITAMLQHFSRIKDELVLPQQYLEFANGIIANDDADDAQTQETHRIKELANAYHTYQQILLENNSMDFSDLISYTIELFRKRPKILKKYQDQFKYILVDEFQDTNSAQYELVKLLLTEPCNITVVGDDDQSIYRFRGASLSNIMNFSNDFQEAKKIILNQNYRSSNKVLKHAYELIQKNNPNRLEFKQKINKELKPNLGIDGRVDHIHSQTLEDEINNVITKIIELKKEYSCNWNDIAVLVRANAHAQPFIELLNQLHLPYKFLALSGLYAKPIILDALAWMRVVNLPYDSPSLYRILSHETLGIDHEDIAKLSMHCKKKCLSLFDALDGNCKLSQSSTLKINEILNTLTTLRINSKRKPASELFVDIIKQTGISACVAMLDEQNQIEQNNLLQKFFERIKKFEYVNEDKTLKNFLSEFELERSGGELGALSGDPTEGPDVVQIMTVHASKGLEFKFVLLVNLVEQRFPSVRKSDPIEVPNGLIMISNVNDVESDEHIEEERRLFYVAMTRAKEHLYIFSSDDYGGLRKRKISRFVSELGLPVITELNKKSIINNSEVYLDKNDYNYKLPKNISFTQIAAFSNCPAQYKFAHILRVPVFGKYQMSFGKSIHDTLEKFAKEYVNLTNTVQQSLFSKQTCDGIVTIPTKEKLFDFYKLAWIDEWYPSAYVKEEYYNKGKDILNDYYDKLITEKPNILLIEKDFTIKIGDLTMKGRIDRIDKIEVGHEIIDYKTGNPKEKLTWDDKKQLILYSLACERCFDPSILITKVTYHYLENNTSVSFKPSDDDKQKLIDDVIKCVDKITHSDFKPTPGFHCQYCDFKDICENSDY